MNRSSAAKLHVESSPEPRSEPPNLRVAEAPVDTWALPAKRGTGPAVPLTTFDENRRFATAMFERFRFLTGLRPAALGSMLVKILTPENRRRILSLSNGLRIYADPFTHLGRELIEQGTLEADTEQVFRAHLHSGGTFLDIGANEGYFSALAGKLVGPSGQVIAIEPQSRLRDLIELNLRINEVGRYHIYTNAFGGRDGSEGQINLWPTHNTGASSIVRTYRFSRATETVRFVSLDRILNECGLGRLDFVKVDVEGFEGEVVRHLVPHLMTRRIGSLYLDYHTPVLTRAGIDPRAIHQDIVRCGYRLVQGDENRLNSYQLYEPTAG